MAKSTFLNLDDNLAAAISYALGPFTGIAALAMERENKFVRFHAMQSTVTFILLYVGIAVLRFIPIINWFNALFVPAMIVLKLFLAYQAFMAYKYKLPIIGDVADNQINK